MARDRTAMPSSMIGTIVWSRYVRIGKFQTAESRAAAPGGSAAGGPGSAAGGLGAAGLGAGGAAGAAGAAGGAAGGAVVAGASMSTRFQASWEQAELADAVKSVEKWPVTTSSDKIAAL